MKSTLQGATPPYIGADLTDRFAKKARSVDVCGLTPRRDGSFDAQFWTWTWGAEAGGLDVSAIAAELGAARVSMLDGPIGLATPPQSMRACERASGAVGKTPSVRPAGRPFASYICSSLDLFAALAEAGLPVDGALQKGSVFECYPGRAWMSLGVRLAKKSTPHGRHQRQTILQSLRVNLTNGALGHDELDACLAAVLAAALDGKMPLPVVALGQQVVRDKTGVLREGRMWVPTPKQPLDVPDQPEQAEAAPKKKAEKRSSPAKSDIDPGVRERAQNLLARLGDETEKGNPRVITYQAAYRELFRRAPAKWSQGYTAQVTSVAASTETISILGLGLARLDTFVVNKQRKPGTSHWDAVTYEPEEWERVFGGAEMTDIVRGA
ncbi:MAG: DUF429 domain-containing protein [Deltaproteobacteria bacterium]|nr:DUF429 domain-containing protein [Deltaproteobacteria bacterium]